MNKIDIKDAVRFLNELLRIDPVGIRALIEAEVTTGAEMAAHPTVQVAPTTSIGRHIQLYALRFLGVLNGLFGTVDPSRVVAAVYDDDTGELLRFAIGTLTRNSDPSVVSVAKHEGS